MKKLLWAVIEIQDNNDRIDCRGVFKNLHTAIGRAYYFANKRISDINKTYDYKLSTIQPLEPEYSGFMVELLVWDNDHELHYNFYILRKVQEH